MSGEGLTILDNCRDRYDAKAPDKSAPVDNP